MNKVLCLAWSLLLGACAATVGGTVGAPMPDASTVVMDAPSRLDETPIVEDRPLPDTFMLIDTPSRDMADSSVIFIDTIDVGRDAPIDVPFVDMAPDIIPVEDVPPHPTLIIETVATSSRIVPMQPTSVRFRGRALFQDVIATRLRIIAEGPWISVQEVGVQHVEDTTLPLVDHGSMRIASGYPDGQGLDIALTTPLRFPVGVWVELLIRIVPRPVVASTDVPAGTFPQSGRVLRIGIEGQHTDDMWSLPYAASLNIEARAATTGEPVYAIGTTTYGSPFIIRRNAPMITLQRLTGADALFTDGAARTLIQYQMSLYNADPVSWEKQTYHVTINGFPVDTDPDQFQLSHFRLQRDHTSLPTTTVRIVDGRGRDLTGSAVPRDGSRLDVIVSFRRGQEEVVATPTVYNLVADVEGSLPGEQLQTGLLFETASPFFSGRLTSEDALLPTPTMDMAELLIGPHLSDVTGVSQSAFFIWSDRVELPTAPRYWTNGWLVNLFGGREQIRLR